MERVRNVDRDRPLAGYFTGLRAGHVVCYIYTLLCLSTLVSCPEADIFVYGLTHKETTRRSGPVLPRRRPGRRRAGPEDRRGPPRPCGRDVRNSCPTGRKRGRRLDPHLQVRRQSVRPNETAICVSSAATTGRRLAGYRSSSSNVSTTALAASARSPVTWWSAVSSVTRHPARRAASTVGPHSTVSSRSP